MRSDGDRERIPGEKLELRQPTSTRKKRSGVAQPSICANASDLNIGTGDPEEKLAWPETSGLGDVAVSSTPRGRHLAALLGTRFKILRFACAW
jgi:hypothetical protein